MRCASDFGKGGAEDKGKKKAGWVFPLAYNMSTVCAKSFTGITWYKSLSPVLGVPCFTDEWTLRYRN